MRDPTVTWAQRLAHRWFPTPEDRRRRSLQLAVFLIGAVVILLGFQLIRTNVSEAGYFETWPAGTAPLGFLLLFVGVCLSLIAFGYLASPLHPWRTAPDEWGDIGTLPPGGTVDRREVANSARLLFVLILVAGLLLLEGILLYNMATTTHLFVRDSCTYNCSALTRAEVAFLIDLVFIGISDAVITVFLFVFIQP